MSPVVDNPVIAPDRELEDDKKAGRIGTAAHPVPALWLVARKEDRWFCSCGHEWNTFDTGGVCPACIHQWTSTECPKCGGWSAHSEWYAQ